MRVIAAVSDLKYISLNLNFLINGIEVQHVWYHCTLIYLVCLVGLKPTTNSLEGYCSILLSYRHIMLLSGFEPPTLCLGGRRSILLSYNSMSTDHILMICDIIPNATVILKVFILKKLMEDNKLCLMPKCFVPGSSPHDTKGFVPGSSPPSTNDIVMLDAFLLHS